MFNVSKMLEDLRLETDKEAIRGMAKELVESIGIMTPENLKIVYDFFGFDRKNLDRDYKICEKLDEMYYYPDAYMLTEYQYNLIKCLAYCAYFGLVVPIKLAIEKVYDIHESFTIFTIPNWREEFVRYGCDHIFKYMEEDINHVNELEAKYGVTCPERMEAVNSIMKMYKDEKYVDSYTEMKKAADEMIAISDKTSQVKEIHRRIFKVCGYNKITDGCDAADMFETCDFSDEAVEDAVKALKELKELSVEYNKNNSLV